MKAGDSVDIHSYHFVFRDVHDIRGPNYSGGVGIIDVTRNGKPEATLHAEKRYYSVARSMMTEAAIDGGFSRDLYAALGELEDGSGRYACITNPSCAGFGSAASLWRSAACCASSTRVTA